MALFGCSRAPKPVERLALPRFENLTGNASLDWMGLAFSEVIQGQLVGSARTNSISSSTLRGLRRSLGPFAEQAPGISTEAPAALVAGANRIAYGRFSIAHGAMRVDVSVEDAATHKIIRTVTATGNTSDGILPLAGAIARQLGDKVRPFGTGSEQALRAYVDALEAPDTASALNNLERSAAADPDFGAAYVVWARMSAAANDRPGAERVLEMARARGSAIPEYDRARLALEDAILRNDNDARMRALLALAKLDPGDPNLFRTLAASALKARQYSAAVNYFGAVTALQPGDVDAWNSLGYAQAYSGNLDGATEALRTYEKLRPSEANPLDSLGDVNFYLGKFSEAEKFYIEASQKDPNFLGGGELLKAAYARLMSGDVPGAEEIFSKYVQARQGARDPLIDYRRAEWQFLTGRRLEGIRNLVAFARTLEAPQARELASRAYAQLAVWNLSLGNRPQAAQQAERAAALAGPATANLASAVRFVTGPDTNPTEWAVRAEHLFPETAPGLMKEFALGYALLCSRHFEAAAPFWKQIYERSDPNSEGSLPVLLAWAYVESGRTSDGAGLLRTNPLPQPAGLDLFTSLYFPRIFYLRGRVLEAQGKVSEAKENYRRFLALSGPTPLAWGEEAKAREALGR
ncbi:MAG: hypothetical protein M1541_03800 [Acidobacteria bacterium]|nr:hypothetical protein [Acidobacteriota bacterium]